ncbi:MAG: fibronectin type III domain-containing protein [Flavobacteriales bacterium]
MKNKYKTTTKTRHRWDAWLFLFLLLFIGSKSMAQVSNYSFTQTSGTYAAITGGTNLGTATANTLAGSLDDVIYIANIGFNFNFNGTDYNQCRVSTNGFITFGAVAPANGLYTPISGTTTYNGAISAWGGDLNSIFNLCSLTGEINYVTTGTAPNRVFTVEWKNFRPSYSTSTTNVARLDFQIKLFEDGNVVEIHYGPSAHCVGATNISTTRQVGLRGATNADYLNLSNTTAVSINSPVLGTANFSSQAFSSINATPGRHADGKIYRFSPPNCIVPGGLNATAVTGTTATLNWSSAPGSTSYEVAWGPAPFTPSAAMGTTTATSLPITGLTALTNYQFYVRNICAGPITTPWSAAGNFSTDCPGTSCNYTVQTYEKWNDGWNGGNLQIIQNSTIRATIVPASGCPGIQTFSVNVCDGVSGVFRYNSGSFSAENSFRILDASSTEILVRVGTETGGSCPPPPFSGPPTPLSNTDFPFTGNCSLPTCFPPTSLAASPTDIDITLSWVPPSPAPSVGYQIFRQTTPTPVPTLATTPTFTTAATSFTDNTALPATTYYYWVRSNCGVVDGLSAWTGPVSASLLPPGDICSIAQPLVCGSNIVTDNTGYSNIGSPAFCGTGPGDRQRWYTFVGTGDIITVTTCAAGGTLNDTKLNVYSGTCSALVCVGGNDDASCGAPSPSTLRSTVTFNSINGVTYYILYSGFLAGQGTSPLILTCQPPPPVPVNDDCVNATILLQEPTCNALNTTSAGAVPPGDPLAACSGNADDDVWFTFVATQTTATVRVVGSATYDAVVQTYTGSCGSLTPFGPCANATGNGGTEQINLTGLTIGATYTIRVHHFGAGWGSGDFSICVFNTPNPCASITPLSCGATNSFTSNGPGIWTLSECGGWPTNGQERLWQFTAPTTGTYTLQVLNASSFTHIFYKPVSTGCNTTGWTCITLPDGVLGGALALPFGPLTAGVSYYILVDAEFTGVTNAQFIVHCPPANDQCASAQLIIAPTLSPPGTLGAPVSGTTLSASPTPSIDPIDPDVWYQVNMQSHLGTRQLRVRLNASSLLAAGVEIYNNNCGTLVKICENFATTQGESFEVITPNSYVGGSQFLIRVYDQLSGTLGPQFSTNFFTIQVGTPEAGLANCIDIPPASIPEAETCGSNTNGGCVNPTQNILMQNATISTSFANFYDSGGPNTNYAPNENFVLTINPVNPGNFMRVIFTGFDVENNWDKLQIFNGPNVASPLFPGGAAGSTFSPCFGLGNGFFGATLPGGTGVFTSTHASGAITFRFCSDGIIENTGWAAILLEVDGSGNPVVGSSVESYSLGDIKNGSVWAQCAVRDVDWYEFTVGSQTPASLNMFAEFPVTFGITTANCFPQTVIAIQNINIPCVTSQASAVLQPGTYRIFVAPNTFQGITCTSARNEYFFQLVAATPPANDDCANAPNVFVGPPGFCPSGGVVGTTLAAIEEVGRPDPTCNTGNISDVWYTFFSGPNTEIEVFTTLISATEIGVELWSNCGTLVAGSCVNGVTDVNPVTYTVAPFTSYRLRVFTNFNNANPGTFRLCIQAKPQPPVNDNICGAITLPVFDGAAAMPTETVVNNFYATNSPQANPTCSGTLSRDMWYRVVIPANGIITVNTFAGTNANPDIAVYASSDNTCNGVLTQLACDDQRGPDNAAWAQIFNGTPGNVLFVRIGGRTNTDRGICRISITSGLYWTGAFTNIFNTIADPGLGIPTNWYCYDGGLFGPSSLSNATISVLIRANQPNQPVVVGNTNIRDVRIAGGFPSSASITVNGDDVFAIHGNLTGNAPIPGRFLGNGFVRFNSTAPFTHSVTQNWRMFGRVTIAPTSTVNAISTGERLTFENNSQLFSNNPSATYGVFNGNIAYRRTSNAGFLAYSYWSSPVIGAPLSVLTQAGMGNVYQYDATLATGNSGPAALSGWQVLGLSPLVPIPVTMQPGRGYIATNGGTATFRGAPQQGDVNYTPINNGIINRMNLIGNPYPSNIRAAGANSFLQVNSTRIAGGALYLWDDDNSQGASYTDGDYVVYTSLGGTVNAPNSGNPFSGRIAAAQGFFVNYAGTGDIQFTNAMRDENGTNAQFFDVVDFKRFRIQLTTSNNWEKDAVVVFKDDATEAYHEMYDVLRLPGSPNAAIFTVAESNEFTLKAFPELTSSRIVNLGVVNTFAGVSSLSMTEFLNFESTTQVFLEDIAMGIFHNLTQNAVYTYENQPNYQGIRFRLHFRAPLQTAAYAACTGEANGKVIVLNPNMNNPVNMTVRNTANEVVNTTGMFVGERVVEGLASGNYTLEFNYADASNINDYVSVQATGFNVAPSFVASATEVSIADAIIEFVGNAQGASQYVWNFGDGTIVTGMLNPVHAYMQPGVYTVTFTATNGGCEATASSVIRVTNNTTGVNNALAQSDVILYPNPAKDQANILLNIDRSETQVKVSIIDATGRLVSSRNVSDLRSGAIITLDVEGLANGMYEVVVEGNAFRTVRKLTIAK